MQEEEYGESWAEFNDASSICYDLPLDCALHVRLQVLMYSLSFLLMALADLSLKIKASMATSIPTSIEEQLNSLDILQSPRFFADGSKTPDLVRTSLLL